MTELALGLFASIVVVGGLITLFFCMVGGDL